MEISAFLSRIVEAALDQPQPTPALRKLLADYSAKPPTRDVNRELEIAEQRIARLKETLSQERTKAKERAKYTGPPDPPASFNKEEAWIRAAIYDLMVCRESAIRNAERIAPVLLQAFLEGAAFASKSEEPYSSDAAESAVPVFIAALRALRKTGAATT